MTPEPHDSLPDDDGLTGYLVTLAFILLSFAGIVYGIFAAATQR